MNQCVIHIFDTLSGTMGEEISHVVGDSSGKEPNETCILTD